MSTRIHRTAGDGAVWPPEAVAATPSDDRTVIYDADNHDAHVRSDWWISLEDAR